MSAANGEKTRQVGGPGPIAGAWERAFAAFYDALLKSTEEAGNAARRNQVLARASGTVIELGAGTGFNLDRVGNASRDEFLQQFRSPPGRSTEYQAGIPQALTLMNGGLITNATSLGSSGLLKSLEIPLITNKDRVEILYMATLSRRPTASEQELLSEYISQDASGNELYESLADVLWALLNSAEFTMNH